MNTDSTDRPELNAAERCAGWLRLLVFFLGIMTATSAAAQVYEHWKPTDQNTVVYAMVSFFNYLVPRVVLSVGFSIVFLFVVIRKKVNAPGPWSKTKPNS